MTTLYGIANCDTVRKTRKWLEQQAVDYRFYDYKKQGCPRELARKLLKQVGADVLINKRGTTWRKLPDSSKSNLTSDNTEALLSEHPSLIKRPIIEHSGEWLVGYDEDAMKELLLGLE